MSALVEMIEAYEAETERLSRRKGTKIGVQMRRRTAQEAREELRNLIIPAHKIEGSKAEFDRYIAGDR